MSQLACLLVHPNIIIHQTHINGISGCQINSIINLGDWLWHTEDHTAAGVTIL